MCDPGLDNTHGTGSCMCNCTGSAHRKPHPLYTSSPLTLPCETLLTTPSAVDPLSHCATRHPACARRPTGCPSQVTTTGWTRLAAAPSGPPAHSAAPPGTSSRCARSGWPARPARRCSWSPGRRRCSPRRVPLARPSCRCRRRRPRLRPRRRHGLTHRGGCACGLREGRRITSRAGARRSCVAAAPYLLTRAWWLRCSDLWG